jgi:hypothetical protein
MKKAAKKRLPWRADTGLTSKIKQREHDSNFLDLLTLVADHPGLKVKLKVWPLVKNGQTQK